MKTCKVCKQQKPLSDYFVNKVNKDGYNIYCKVCYKEKFRDTLKASIKKYLAKPEIKEKQKAYYKEYMPKYAKMNRERINEKIYNWNDRNKGKQLDQQLKYQSAIPPAVYSITYKGDVIYVGSSKSPIRRQNVHFSTLTTCNNIGNINKLHSYYGYDKADFAFHIIEECDEDQLLIKEREYQVALRPDINYKYYFDIKESVRTLIERLGLKNGKTKTWKNRKYDNEGISK